MTLAKQFYKILQPYTHLKTLFVGFSGGLDSTVLLRLLVELQAENFTLPPIKALHICHGLSVHAEAWSRHCSRICEEWSIFFDMIEVNAKPKRGESPEAAARTARYQAFKEVINNQEALVTAHQQDDQAETLLLQIFRGTGLAGIAAMPLEKKFHKGLHLRPLLPFTRKNLEDYAQKHQLTWVEDESNQSHSYDRNYLRQVIMPLIKDRWPSVTRTLSRTSKNCAEVLHYFEKQKKMFLPFSQDDFTATLSCVELLNAPEFIGRQILRQWLINIAKHFIPYQDTPVIPNQRLLEIIFREVVNAKSDAIPQVQWQNLVIRRYKKKLYAEKYKYSQGNTSENYPVKTIYSQQMDFRGGATRNEPRSLQIVNEQANERCNKPENSLAKSIDEEILESNFFTLHLSAEVTIKAKKLKGEGFKIVKNKGYQIRFRQGGEKILLNGQHKTLKNLFQEWNIPPWQRNHWPLIFYQEEFIAVIDFAIADNWKTSAAEEGWCLEIS